MTIASQDRGFTVVEMLISMLFAAAILTGFYQLYSASLQSSYDTKRFAKANELAYSNLQKYTTKPTMPACGAAGLPATLSGWPTTTTVEILGSGVVQTVKASYAYPCAQQANVVKIESTVTFKGIEVSRASFINY